MSADAGSNPGKQASEEKKTEILAGTLSQHAHSVAGKGEGGNNPVTNCRLATGEQIRTEIQTSI
jgi:hypothetical protein